MKPAYYKRPVPRRVFGLSVHAWLALGVAVVGVLAGFTITVISTDCNGIKQSINMRTAQRHIDAHSAALLAKPGREAIALDVYTGGPCGAIMVKGECASEEAANSLRADIAATNPPITVLFLLSVPDSGYLRTLRIEPISASK